MRDLGYRGGDGGEVEEDASAEGAFEDGDAEEEFRVEGGGDGEGDGGEGGGEGEGVDLGVRAG